MSKLGGHDGWCTLRLPSSPKPTRWLVGRELTKKKRLDDRIVNQINGFSSILPLEVSDLIRNDYEFKFSCIQCPRFTYVFADNQGTGATNLWLVTQELKAALTAD